MTGTILPKPEFKKLTKIRALFIGLFFFISVALGILVSWITLRGDLEQFNWNIFIETSADWLERWPMMLIAIILLLVVIFTSGLRLHLLLNIQVKKLRFLDSIYYGILARYYVLITPWGLGGQPILMGIMHQKKIPLGLATSAPMFDLLMMRLAMFLFVMVALLGYGHLVDPLVYLFAWVGFFITCLVPVVMILGSFHARFSQFLIDIIGWLVPAKKRSVVQTKLSKTLGQYRDAFGTYKHHPIRFFGVAVFALLSQFALLAIPYFVMASFNLDNGEVIPVAFTLGHIVMMMAIANTILGTVPTLGSAGAAEFTFATVFSNFISGNALFWAIFVWRFLLFYLWLIMGLTITFYQGIFYRREARRYAIPQPDLPLKVILFNDGFYPLIDGVVRAVDAYARFLVNHGVDVTVVVPFNGNIKSYPYKVLAIRQIKIPGFFYPIPIGVNRIKYKKILYYEGPIVYHSHTPFLLGHLALKLSRQFHIPLVTTFHSKYYDDYYAVTKNQRVAQIFNHLTMRYFSKANALWTVSNATIDTIREYGIKDRSIKVFQNGTDLVPHPEAPTIKTQIKKTYQIKSSQRILLFVGQLIWQKNIKLIIDTFTHLSAAGFKGYLFLVGEGRDQDDIRTYAKSTRFGSHIIFTGKISDYATLSAFYILADIFFFPSLYDTDGIVIKEAAAHQLPTLVMGNSSAAKAIKDNVNGFVQNGDASDFSQRIITIFQDLPLLKKVANQAKIDLVKSWDQTLATLIDSYKQLIDDYYSQ